MKNIRPFHQVLLEITRTLQHSKFNHFFQYFPHWPCLRMCNSQAISYPFVNCNFGLQDAENQHVLARKRFFVVVVFFLVGGGWMNRITNKLNVISIVLM